MFLERSWSFVSESVRINPNDDRSMTELHLIPIEVLFYKLRYFRFDRRLDGLKTVFREFRCIQPSFDNAISWCCPRINLDASGLVDRSVRKPETKSADKTGIVMVCAPTPTQGVSRH